MKHTLLLFSLALSCTWAFSQDMSLQWAKQIGGTGNQVINNVARDAFSNTVIAGQYEGIVDFDPSTGSAISSSAGQYDAFIAKYDPSGNFLWKYHFGNNEQDYAWDVAIDGSGFIYVAGEARGAIDIDMNSETADIDNVSTGSYGFLVKIDGSGNHVWSKYWDGTTSNSNKLTQVALDNAGNPVIAGENYNGYLDLDPGDNTTEVDGAHRLFYEKLTSSGNLVWAKSLTGYSTYDAIITELMVDASNSIFMSGHFQSIIDFDPSTSTYEFNGNGPADGFIAKYASNGDFSWVRTFFNGSGPVYFNDMDINSNGEIIATGSYSYTTDFDPDLINTYNLDAPSYMPRGFLLQLSSAGIFGWVKNLTSEVESSGTQVNCDDNDQIMVAGYYTATADLDPDPNTTFNVVSIGLQDIFMSKFDNTGSFIYANIMNSTANDRITAMQHITGSSNFITGGYFENTIDLDPNTGNASMTSAQSRDAFIALYAECTAQAVTIQDVGCGEYQWNNSFYVESGTYTQTLISMSGCDSIVTLELTIALPTSSNLVETACDSYTILDQTFTESGNYTLHTDNALGCDSTIFLSLTIEPLPSFEITISGNTMTSTSGESYQWVECLGDNEFTIVEGANEQTYSPNASGSFAVLVTSGVCSAYSDCVEFTYIGVDEEIANTIQLYPNPAHDFLQINVSNANLGQRMRITDMTGRIVHQFTITSNTKTIDITTWAVGLYHVHTDSGQAYSFIKE